jgi:hypothetical protein
MNPSQCGVLLSSRAGLLNRGAGDNRDWSDTDVAGLVLRQFKF